MAGIFASNGMGCSFIPAIQNGKPVLVQEEMRIVPKQRSEYVSRGRNDYVELKGVDIRYDSASGEAVEVYFPQLDTGGEAKATHWVPYSQIDMLQRTPTSCADTIRMSRWLAKKIGLEV